MHHAAQVDYITVTTSERTGRLAEPELAWLAGSLVDQAREEYPVESSNWHGYEGWSCGPVKYGWRDDGFLLQVSGRAAEGASRLLPQAGYNVSRCDLAYTHWGGLEDFRVRGAVEERARAAAAAARAPRKPQVTLIDGGAKGETLCIGSRSSAQYGRIYNKEVESRQSYYKGAWRWEVEYKAPLASQVVRALARDETRAPQISSVVGAWFLTRGVDCPAAMVNDHSTFVLPSRVDTDDARFVEWLRRQVAPAIAKRRLRLGDDVLYSALGLREDRPSRAGSL